MTAGNSLRRSLPFMSDFEFHPELFEYRGRASELLEEAGLIDIADAIEEVIVRKNRGEVLAVPVPVGFRNGLAIEPDDTCGREIEPCENLRER